jgi:hypothetical protein
MAYGEQAAFEGLLARLKPTVSVEIGTYMGGSLACLARHSDHVHTFDLVSHVDERLPNVTYHLGDSAVLVPRVLQDLAANGSNVDFVLVDGDHAPKGVERDVLNLLTSPALRRTVILLHDVHNEGVRLGIKRALRMKHQDVKFVDLSWVPSARNGQPLGELWGGLGMIVVDQNGTLWPDHRSTAQNVKWRASTPRPMYWHALSPVRRMKRAAMYAVRPYYRKWRGTRGIRM